MSRKLLVWGERDFTVEIPDDAKVTFGPFSPPTAASRTKPAYSASPSPVGTLRIYKGSRTAENVLAVFSGVEGFRDESLMYEPVELPAEVVSYDTLTKAQKEEMGAIIARQFAAQAMSAAMEEGDANEDDDGPSPF